MIPLSFRTKLLVSYLALVAFVVLLATFELNRSLGEDLVRQLDTRLTAQAEGAAQWIGAGRHPNRLASRLAGVVGAEIALIDSTGRILGYADPRSPPVRNTPGAAEPDTPPPPLTDSAPRPEIDSARTTGKGFATRSAPGGQPMRYVAVAAPGGLVLRLGVPLSGVEDTLRSMRTRLLFAAALAMAAAVLLGIAASRLVARPLREMSAAARKIAAGDYKVRVPDTTPDELGDLAKALASMATQLESRIGDLTAERDRLEALLTQVRRLEVVRRDFIANVSHELRTPVTAIQGYAETLLEAPPDSPLPPETASRFLATIYRHAQRLARLLEDLLQLSSLESRPEGDTPKEPVPLLPLAQEVAATVRDRCRDRKATLTLEVPEDAIAEADPAALEQVLENLTDNALKHTPEGTTVTLRASLHPTTVRIQILDTGPGIPPEHLPRLFERFYRTDPSRSRDQGGAGLGLAIVKHLVERMQGTVTADSTLGQGSTFTVTLPRSTADRPS
ncbi:MAG: ATP-binding protein [Polyangiaceae bacterium]